MLINLIFASDWFAKAQAFGAVIRDGVYLVSDTVNDALRASKIAEDPYSEESFRKLMEQLCEGHEGANARLIQSEILKRVPGIDAPEVEWQKYIEINLHACSNFGKAKQEEEINAEIQGALVAEGYVVEKLPFASGSMCSVYKAKKDDKTYVVKVVHKESVSRVAMAQKIASGFASTLPFMLKGRFGMDNGKEIIESMHTSYLEDCDLARESEKAKVMQAFFVNHPHIKIPQSLKTNDKFLLMEFLTGEEHIADYFSLTKPEVERVQIARVLLDFLFTSLANGWWYGDPNACCAKINKREGQIILEMLDFGSCEQFTPRQAKALIDFCLHNDQPQHCKEFFNAFGCNDGRSIQELSPLFRNYIKNLARNELVQILTAREDVNGYEEIRKHLATLGNINGPVKALSLMKWFQQVTVILYALHLPPMNFHEMIEKIVAKAKPQDENAEVAKAELQEELQQ